MADNVTNIAEKHVEGVDLTYRAPTKPEHVKAQLPRPILRDDADWLDLYWRTWSIAYDKIKVPDPVTGLVPYCDAAFSHNIFQWDTCFMLRFLRYAPPAFFAAGSLDNFYRKQHEDGFICREINSISGNDFWEASHNSSINPPLFADAEWSLFQSTGDRERVALILEPLKRHYWWLSKNRRAHDGTGFWTSALGSGMDNSPRAHDGGGIDVHEHHDHTWMCMTAQMALAALRISQLAGSVGEAQTEESFGAEYVELRNYVRETFWNEELGFYADLKPDGSVSDILTPATCWPLLLPGESHSRIKLVEAALIDPQKLGRHHMVASLSADHPLYDSNGNYWRGSVWPPMVALAVRAMQECARAETARRIATNHLSVLRDVYRESGTFWENYAPDRSAPGQIARPEFVGWTGCGPIAMLIETIIGIDVRAQSREIAWNLHRKDRHGVENLSVGDGRVSLVYDPERACIDVSSTESFNLLIWRGEHRTDISVNPETTEIAVRL